MPEQHTVGPDLAHAQSEDQAKTEGFQTGDTTGRPADEASRKSSDLRGEVTDTVRDAGERIQEKGAETAERLRRKGEEVAENQKSWAADELSHLSQAVRSAADHLHDEDDHRLADYAATTAERLDEVSHYLRTKDWRGLVDDAEELGRRRPEMFLGGMFLAGVGIARFLKASGHRHTARNEGQSWADGGPPSDLG